jgi:hypothetical protein
MGCMREPLIQAGFASLLARALSWVLKQILTIYKTRRNSIITQPANC